MVIHCSPWLVLVNDILTMTIYGDYSWLIRIFDVCKYCIYDNGIIMVNHWILVVVQCLIMVNITICFILQ